MIDKNAINELKTLEWLKILTKAAANEDLNDRSWRFLKATIIELIFEKYGPAGIKYVGAKEIARDYDWPRYGLNVELKSSLSSGMYNKKDGTLKKIADVKLNNSLGTNKQTTLPLERTPDVLLVIKNDGAYVLTKETIQKCATHQGDGWMLKIDQKDIIEISGKINRPLTESLNMRNKVIDAIRQVI